MSTTKLEDNSVAYKCDECGAPSKTDRQLVKYISETTYHFCNNNCFVNWLKKTGRLSNASNISAIEISL